MGLHLLVVFLALACTCGATTKCRTRTAGELEQASTARVVFTPAVRSGPLVSNTFLPAAEFAGLMNNGLRLPNLAPCVLSSAGQSNGEATFVAVRGGPFPTAVTPGAKACKGEDGKDIASLKDVRNEVFVIVHGTGQSPRVEVGFGEGGRTGRHTYTPDELAELLVAEGLACDTPRITLMVLSGGLSITTADANGRYIELYRKMQVASTQEEQVELQEQWADLAMRHRDPRLYEANADMEGEIIPFVTLLAMALRVRGFVDCQVVGFRGEVSTHLGPNPTNSGRYRGLRVMESARSLATRECASLGDGEAIDDCLQTLLVPCDRCMLSQIGKGSFQERQRRCRRILAGGNTEERASAHICRTKYHYVNPEWVFSVSSRATEALEQF